MYNSQDKVAAMIQPTVQLRQEVEVRKFKVSKILYEYNKFSN